MIIQHNSIDFHSFGTLAYCELHGQCVDGIGSFDCNCAGTGFEGDKCQYGNQLFL